MLFYFVNKAYLVSEYIFIYAVKSSCCAHKITKIHKKKY